MNKKAELVILAAGLICLILFAALPLFFPDPEIIEWSYLKQARIAAGVFYGATATDLGQDIVGMRALWSGADAYPLLGPAMEDLGLHWDLDFHSPHPPTSFLFTAPVAFFPWATASLLWAVLMIICWIGALRLLGLSWNLSVGSGGLLLLWPPAAFSLGQLTAIWLFFLCLAYAWRAKDSGAPGAAIGLAAMTKFTPVVALTNFIASKKRWQILSAFVISWLISLATVFLLNASAISRYLDLNQSNSQDLIHRPENAAPIGVLLRWIGLPGVLIWLAFLALILIVNWRWIRENSMRGWMATFYLSVAFLPVLWIYSLLLLLPVAYYLLTKNKNRISQALTIGAIGLTFFSPAFGIEAMPYVSTAVLLSGLALLPQP